MAARSFDLIVVGGGVFGLSTALEAGRRGGGRSVVDRGAVPNPIAASYGPSRKIRSTYLDPHYTRLALEAMAAWRQLEAETGKELYVADGNLNVSDGASRRAPGDARGQCPPGRRESPLARRGRSAPGVSRSSAEAAALSWRRRRAFFAPPTAWRR